MFKMLFSAHVTILIHLAIQVRGQLSSSSGCKCGVRNEAPFEVRISGGKESAVNEFPWAALLKVKENGRAAQRCGGTLINDRYNVFIGFYFF